jgi:hypothetical protein
MSIHLTPRPSCRAVLSADLSAVALAKVEALAKVDLSAETLVKAEALAKEANLLPPFPRHLKYLSSIKHFYRKFIEIFLT